MKHNEQILNIKITIVGTEPRIWRRIIMPADAMFFDLHVAIQDAFGWQDSHLHQFFTANPFSRNAHYQRISYPMPVIDTGDDSLDERKEKLTKWLKAVKDAVWYEYDFGDSWMHEIRLEKILPKETKKKYPQLLDGARACPTEDSGGIGGYDHLCQILANPKHKEHEEMLEWLEIESAAEFKPEYFVPEEVHFRNPKHMLRWYSQQFK